MLSRIPKTRLAYRLSSSYSTVASKTVETVPLVNDPSYRIPNNATLVSGIQPTGAFHLGNFLGATKTWHLMAERIKAESLNSQMIFFVADLHSLTVPQDFSLLKQHRIEALASIIACGLNPDDAIIYCQSDVPEHTQLQWALTCFTGMGYLNRMTQWKSKSNISSESEIATEIGKVKLGLFAYPVLMAADVLLFNTTHCPVGLDQAQHLELTREIAQAFNRTTNTKYFNLPKTLLAPTNKILSLSEPLKKMSKSAPEENSKISMTDSPQIIHRKIMKATTDSIEGKLTFDTTRRPGISNLMTIYSATKNVTVQDILPEVEDLNKKEFKELVAEAVVEELKEPSRVYSELMADPEMLQKWKMRGAERARTIASKNLKDVYKILGMD